jgi:acyl carrier protein
METTEIGHERVLVDKVLVALERATGVKDIDLEKSLADFGLDSVLWLEMVMQLERTFHIHVPDDRIPSMGSVRDIVELVRALSAVHS